MKSAFILRRGHYATHPDTQRLVFVAVYEVPHELPDSVLEYRLRKYGTIYSTRRDKVPGYSNVFNGLRHLHMQPDVPESTPAQVEISAAPEDLALSISDSILAHLKMPSATPDDFVPSVSDSILVQMRTPFLVEIPSVVDVPAPSAAIGPESLVAVDVPAADLGLN